MSKKMKRRPLSESHPYVVVVTRTKRGDGHRLRRRFGSKREAEDYVRDMRSAGYGVSRVGWKSSAAPGPARRYHVTQILSRLPRGQRLPAGAVRKHGRIAITRWFSNVRDAEKYQRSMQDRGRRVVSGPAKELGRQRDTALRTGPRKPPRSSRSSRRPGRRAGKSSARRSAATRGTKTRKLGFATMRFQLPKGLDRKAASKMLFEKARARGKMDARGISYDPRTGKGSIT